MKTTEGANSFTFSNVVPFVAPFFAFMIFLSVADGNLPEQHYLLYPIKSLLVAVIVGFFWKSLPSLAPSSTLLSVLVGIIGVVLWVGLDPLSIKLDAFLGNIYNNIVSTIGLASWKTEIDASTPIGRDPFQLYPANVAWLLFTLRVLGISLCVPVMEELFWRGFLMRWLIKEDFASVPIGTYTHMSFWITTACFAMVHGSEWPLAVIVGILYGFWFVRTRHLGDIMVAHGVTNFLLAFYCLFANDWHFLSIAAPIHK